MSTRPLTLPNRLQVVVFDSLFVLSLSLSRDHRASAISCPTTIVFLELILLFCYLVLLCANNLTMQMVSRSGWASKFLPRLCAEVSQELEFLRSPSERGKPSHEVHLFFTRQKSLTVSGTVSPTPAAEGGRPTTTVRATSERTQWRRWAVSRATLTILMSISSLSYLLRASSVEATKNFTMSYPCTCFHWNVLQTHPGALQSLREMPTVRRSSCPGCCSVTV